MAPETPTVNKPTDMQKKEADVNRKLQLYGIINAFQQGKVPSNEQIDVALNSFLESSALSNPSAKLSAEGKTLVKDARNVVKQAKYLLLSKNEGNLLQDFIWQTQLFDPKAVNFPGAPVTKETAKQHGDKVLEGFRTLGTLVITNGQFRKLLSDATVLLRDIAGDAASNAANRVKPSDEALSQIDDPAEDNTWHDRPDFSNEGVKKAVLDKYHGDPTEDAKAVAHAGTSVAYPEGSSDPSDLFDRAAREGRSDDAQGVDAEGGLENAAQTLQQRLDANIDSETKEKTQSKAKEYRSRTKAYLSRKMPQERREHVIWRLKKMVVECQQHSDYQQAIQTLLNLAEEYGDHAQKLAEDGSHTVDDTRSCLTQVESNLKTLIERFANGTSTDDLWDAIKQIYHDTERDEEFKNWFRSLNQYICRSLQEQGYILEDESKDEWNRVYDNGNHLLRTKYRAHTDRVVEEIKFLVDQFDKDSQNSAFAAAMTKLCTDLGNDENGKPTFKPHLIKDLTEVIIPSVFENVSYVPIPRIEYSDPQVDLVVENLVLESDNFMPNVLEIASENFMRWGRKNIANKKHHTFEVKVAGIQMDLRDVSYYVKRKQGFPALTDQGVASIIFSGDGLNFRLKFSTATKGAGHFFKIEKCDVDLKHLKIKLAKSNHKLLFNLFKGLMLKLLRPALQKAISQSIEDQSSKFDTFLYDIKQEADRALVKAREQPEQVQNIYNRYLQAAQKQITQGKQKAQKVQKSMAEKNINYAVTKEDSIFPNIYLPGGISSKATEYRELARTGDRWASPVFSIGKAAKSTDIPHPPRVMRKSRAVNGVDSSSSHTSSSLPVGDEVNPATTNPAAII